MTQYKTRDLQIFFDVTGETIRAWSNEFSPYLSPTATPGENRHRIFSDEDMAVFALIASMKREGKIYADIHAALRAGQRGDLAEVISETNQIETTTAQLALIQQQLLALREERDEASARAHELHDEVIKLKTQLEFYQNQTDKLEKLQREIGKLEALLEIERNQKD